MHGVLLTARKSVPLRPAAAAVRKSPHRPSRADPVDLDEEIITGEGLLTGCAVLHMRMRRARGGALPGHCTAVACTRAEVLLCARVAPPMPCLLTTQAVSRL